MLNYSKLNAHSKLYKTLLHSFPFMFSHPLFWAYITCTIKSQVHIWYERNKRHYSATFPCVRKKLNFYIVIMVQNLRWIHRFIVCEIFCNVTSAYLVTIISHSFHWKTNFNSIFFSEYCICRLIFNLICVMSLTKCFEFTAAVRVFHV